MKIAGNTILPGVYKQIDVNIAKLPSGTLIDIPIGIYQSPNPGPSLLLLAGMHGDEINGVEIMRRILKDKLYKVDRGTVICIPIINVYGFINFSREVPDGKDINRSFPGSKSGSLASQVAHFLMTEIIPHIDYGIDFHTGGAKINNFPQIRMKIDDDENLALAKAFSTRFILNSNFREKSLRKEAYKLGKRILVYEGGESLRLRKSTIEDGIQGTLRVMKHLGMIAEAPTAKPSIIIDRSTWIRAKSAGVHFAYKQNGQLIKAKEEIGQICDPFGQYEIKIKAQSDTHILAINNQPVVNRGDALFHVGYARES